MMFGSAPSSPPYYSKSGSPRSGSTSASKGLDSTYGAAASIVVALVWVYYTSQIILLGAEGTHVFEKHRGSRKTSEWQSRSQQAADKVQ
jgi:membrane protein